MIRFRLNVGVWAIAWILIAALQPGQAADLTAFVGGVKAGKLDIEGIRSALDASPMFGARLASDFVPFFGHEHTIAFSSDYLFPRSTRAIREARGFVYNSNLILNLAAGRVVPYLTAGLGVIHQYGDRNLPVGTRFATNYGGGVKIPRVFGALGLRFDARGYTAVGLGSGKLNMIEISGGLLLSFGR